MPDILNKDLKETLTRLEKMQDIKDILNKEEIENKELYKDIENNERERYISNKVKDGIKDIAATTVFVSGALSLAVQDFNISNAKSVLLSACIGVSGAYLVFKSISRNLKRNEENKKSLNFSYGELVKYMMKEEGDKEPLKVKICRELEEQRRERYNKATNTGWILGASGSVLLNGFINNSNSVEWLLFAGVCGAVGLYRANLLYRDNNKINKVDARFLRERSQNKYRD